MIKPEMKFFVEQIAICPNDPERAIALLTKMGLADWARDHVKATGHVFGSHGENEADLAFNYQATRGYEAGALTDAAALKPLELEVLNYTHGNNWMQHGGRDNSVSHIGMHCTAAELDQWRAFFLAEGIKEAQGVLTLSHTNPFLLANGRKYRYTIFDTREILGVDVKFIVRIEK